ncbi:LacI family DNA-binding transcriptional regulator [Paenibacillus naphthalenovorans]|uniref:LacI family transcriptional regulator n=1 Tax=Paenibacillus naphthalenovorans TaxID=162209 RepID=A0A0U2MYJ4_9BACL|nr:LacI family DNA-binding transcriptional regulator [Paenibacillus naphthalenovorans]ALS23359.1 LacI family transcriptional regulator [Paenibacillus naphthalenovorans]GCL72839.1 LacI family transcriptional regulator [Paenibacillus naphthalenovorans]
MTPTIKDVAAAAGVSIGTVSKVINKSGFVSEKIRERVLLAITLLNYKPNAVARSLKQSKTHLIGIIVDDISNLYMMKIIKSVENLATEMEYNLISCSHNNRPEEERKALQRLMEKRVDGIIMVPTGSNLDELNMPNNIPVILVDRKVENARFDTVVHENINTSITLVQHLYLHGRRKFLFIHGALRHSVEIERVNGIKKAIHLLGLDMSAQVFLEVGAALGHISAEVRKYLEHSGLPEGIYATNHLALAGTVRALWDMGVQVPEEVSVAGFGDIDTYGLLRPSFTLAKEDPCEVGKIASELLFERIEFDKQVDQPKEFLVTPKITIGTSCGTHVRP